MRTFTGLHGTSHDYAQYGLPRTAAGESHPSILHGKSRSSAKSEA